MGLRRRFDTTQIIIEKALKPIFHLRIDFLLPPTRENFHFVTRLDASASFHTTTRSTFNEKHRCTDGKSKHYLSVFFLSIESIEKKKKKNFQFRALLSVMWRRGLCNQNLLVVLTPEMEKQQKEKHVRRKKNYSASFCPHTKFQLAISAFCDNVFPEKIFFFTSRLLFISRLTQGL